MLYQSDGIVLDQMNLGENDKLATVFTSQAGIVKAVVKGGQRPKSKLRAVTQPLTHGVFQFYKGRNLDRVTQVSVKRGYPGIIDNYEKMIYARYLIELLIGVLPEREVSHAQFQLFLKVLDCLEQKQDPWIIARWAELGILSLAGFAPSFSKCISCGAQEPEPPVYFSLRNGGAVCGQCMQKERQGLANMANAQGRTPGKAQGEARGAARDEAKGDVQSKRPGLVSELAHEISHVSSAGRKQTQVQGNVFSAESQVRSYGELIRVSPGCLRTLEILLSGIVSHQNAFACPKINARGQVREEITQVSRKYVAFVLEKRLKSADLVESIEDGK